MLTVSNEYGIYLYSDKVDMRKGIDGLCGIVRSQMGLSPFKSKSIFVFGGKNCKRRFRPRPRRSACLVHIRRGMVDALGENHDEAMWFIDEIGKIFSVEYHCKKMGMSANERLVERLKTGSTADIMAGIEQRLRMHEASGYAGCGALMKKALKYALAEWPAMKRVLENGAVEISNNLAEQMMRHIKMNLQTESALEGVL